jgi:V8-like Glu-specific endopeptidase
MKKQLILVLLASLAAKAGFASARPHNPSAGGDGAQRVNIFNSEGNDPRERVDVTREQALRPIVQIPGSTAFLVSPCYALAAYHGVFGSHKPSDLLPTITVRVPDIAEDGSLSFKAIEATPALWGEGYRQNAIREDWALLRLSICEGARVGWMELLPHEANLGGTPIAMAGYPNDKSRASLWQDRTGSIHQEGVGVLKDCLLNSAATRGGSSGSPIYQRNTRNPVVVGMQVRVRNEYPGIIAAYDGRQANIALDIRPIYRRIEALIVADMQAFWAEIPERAGINPAHPLPGRL